MDSVQFELLLKVMKEIEMDLCAILIVLCFIGGFIMVRRNQ